MLDILSQITESVPMAITLIGILVVIVTAVTEIIKNAGPLAKIPTNLVVLVLSLAFAIVLYFSYIQVATLPFIWYELVAAIMLGFAVAYVAMFGWDKFNQLLDGLNRKQ